VDALKAAARRGVDVRLLVPLKSNHIVADWTSRGYFSQLLESGVRILRYRDAMVHAKTATVDGTWTTVGTANIDRLSLSGNYEINIEVIDRGL
ncbi:phospholipase D-like domain-containing protein, partial [Klebsiella pneumoniae]